MKHPQTLAVELNKQFPNPELEIIGKNGCCAFVLLWCLGLESSDIEAILTVQRMRKADVIRKDCVVYWYKAVPFLTGRELEDVQFVKIKSLKGIKKRTPVLMAKEGNAEGEGHWVGVENGRIKCRPLEYSVNESEGKPVEMRVLKIKGVD